MFIVNFLSADRLAEKPYVEILYWKDREERCSVTAVEYTQFQNVFFAFFGINSLALEFIYCSCK